MWQEADREFKRNQPQLRAHPDVLGVRWQIYAKADDWKTAVELASVIIEQAPGKSRETMYQLARFAFRSNRLWEAREWLEKALKTADRKMKLKALTDRDLEAAWKS